jgi:hypothetical protein
MRIMAWHVHGGWMDAFVRGDHEYLLPTTPDGRNGTIGRAGRDWPASVIETAPSDFRDADVDVVVAQRLEELDEAERLLGRRIGIDVPLVFVEHNTPKADVPFSRHPLADRSDLTIVHVTHFNDVFWDCGSTRTTVIEHGVVDPGPLYSGEFERLGAVINEPVRRWRVTGTDLLPAFAAVAPVDVFGMATDLLEERFESAGLDIASGGDLPTASMHTELARRRAYVHPLRWTSLGLSLLEAMHMGMPVVALATTEAYRAVPPDAGFLSTDVAELVSGARRLIDDPDFAARCGNVAREFAIERFGITPFLENWSTVLEDARETVAHSHSTPL